MDKTYRPHEGEKFLVLDTLVTRSSNYRDYRIGKIGTFVRLHTYDDDFWLLRFEEKGLSLNLDKKLTFIQRQALTLAEYKYVPSQEGDKADDI